MYTVVVVELKWSVIVHIVADNNTFLSSNYKCCVMYFIKKIAFIRCACDNMQTLKVFGNGMQFYFLFII
jgi:hypothetical protein